VGRRPWAGGRATPAVGRTPWSTVCRVTDERSDDEPAPEKDPSPPASDEGGIHGWRERHREKLIAEYEEAGDLRGEEEEVDDEKWKIVSENPSFPGQI